MELVYPQSHELRTIGQKKIVRALAGDPLLALMPRRTRSEPMIVWDQADDYVGLQQYRGLDGSPVTVKRTGKKRYSMDPGAFGEVIPIGESELTLRAGMGGNDPIDLTELVNDAQDQLIVREISRLRHTAAELFVNGVISIPMKNGDIGYVADFSIQTQAGSDWASPATATPIKDMRVVQSLSTGSSVSFGTTATALANLKTITNMLNNQNAADLRGERVTAGNTVSSLPAANQVFLGAGLPAITEYNETWTDDDGTVRNFIPDGKVVIVGARSTGERVAEYRMTRNTNNPNWLPGSYDAVIDKTGNGPDGQRQIGKGVEVHRGHNGGPVIYFPSAIVVLTVSA